MTTKEENRMLQGYLAAIKRAYGLGGYLEIVWLMREYSETQRNRDRLVSWKVKRAFG